MSDSLLHCRECGHFKFHHADSTCRYPDGCRCKGWQECVCTRTQYCNRCGAPHTGKCLREATGNPGHVRWEDLADAVIAELRKDKRG